MLVWGFLSYFWQKNEVSWDHRVSMRNGNSGVSLLSPNKCFISSYHALEVFGLNLIFGASIFQSNVLLWMFYYRILEVNFWLWAFWMISCLNESQISCRKPVSSLLTHPGHPFPLWGCVFCSVLVWCEQIHLEVRKPSAQVRMVHVSWGLLAPSSREAQVSLPRF